MKPTIAVAESVADGPSNVHFYDLNSTRRVDGAVVPIETLKAIHKTPILEMKFSRLHNTVVSVDIKGTKE
jgi:hypothetical protein